MTYRYYLKSNFWSIFLILMMGCSEHNNKKTLNHIKENCHLVRLDSFMFGTHKPNFDSQIQLLKTNYPGFAEIFLLQIIGLNQKHLATNYAQFIDAYQPIYNVANHKFGSFDTYYDKIISGFSNMQRFFPNYSLPKHIYTFIAPFNSYACILAPDGLGIGLQMYLGSDYSLYYAEDLNKFFPSYMIRKFDAHYLIYDAMFNVVNDIFPEKKNLNALLEQMIESGKKKYVVKQILPEIEDTILFGMTSKHYQNLQKEIENIWTYLLQNKLLYSRDPLFIRDFVGEGPYCTALGEGLPADLGSYLGFLIVQKWVKTNKKTLQDLILQDNLVLFNESGFRP
ncbi:MAG: hypothetical protein QM539_00620 [Alphaproteobacteria bacterium]|nr:hypothetical protein [Alphaproteobacteria bacterium]